MSTPVMVSPPGWTNLGVSSPWSDRPGSGGLTGRKGSGPGKDREENPRDRLGGRTALRTYDPESGAPESWTRIRVCRQDGGGVGGGSFVGV